MRRSSNKLRTVIRWSVRLGLVAFIGLCIVLVLASRDEPPVDIGTATFQPRELPDSENAYLLAMEVARLEQAIKTDGDRDAIFATLRQEIPWNQDRVDELLNRHHDVIIRFLALAPVKLGQATTFGTPIDEWQATTPDVKMPGILVLLQARARAETGQADESRRLLRATDTIATTLCESQGNPLQTLYAMGLKSSVLWELERSIRQFPIPRPDASEWIHQLETSRPSAESWQVMIARDIQANNALIEACARPASLPDGMILDHKMTFWDKLPYRISFLFKPNATKRIMLTIPLAASDWIDLPWTELTQRYATYDSLRYGLCDHYEDWINRYGKQLAHNASPFFESIAPHRMRLNYQSLTSLTQALIALRAYHDIHNGELPETLDGLVPEYLPSVPRDYYDGQPVKYSRELKALWSVGPNDLVLRSPDQDIQDDDIVIPVRFDGDLGPWEKSEVESTSGPGLFGPAAPE